MQSNNLTSIGIVSKDLSSYKIQLELIVNKI